jgi:hypothetical protein
VQGAADALWSSLGEDRPPIAPAAATGSEEEHHHRAQSSAADGREGGSAEGVGAVLDELQGRVAALQGQLEEQRQLLRALCDRLPPPPTAALNA